MALPYPDSVTVTRGSGGTPDGMGGTTGGSTSTVWSGTGDYQDGAKMHRATDGTIVAEGDGVLYLPVPLSDVGAQPGDAVTVEYGGDNGTGSETFVVVDASRLDDALTLRRA
jgi:hypothetical protein